MPKPQIINERGNSSIARKKRFLRDQKVSYFMRILHKLQYNSRRGFAGEAGHGRKRRG